MEFCDDGIQWIFFQDCDYGCTSGSCNSPPPAATATTKPTATPTVKPSCSANGITCSINSQCCSSHCVTGICVANCSANGITCSINSQCCSGICSGICQPKPTSTPPAATSTPPTPTPVPCTTCGQSTMVCTYVCDTCTPGKTTGYKDISCWA
ncbi:hypothetical protein KBB48_03450, partial [Candidatus Shapirobacteria bacterium]|nr:hypothetical protein [Candidatus Shapirobacteria bacterium]